MHILLCQNANNIKVNMCRIFYEPICLAKVQKKTHFFSNT